MADLMHLDARGALAATFTLIALGALLAAPAARAQNGLSDDRVSLPDGPGSIGGVGENVEVNPNMGSAAFRVPLRVPTGANEAMTPQLALAYASGAGMGVAGIGWDLESPCIERMVARGLPEYTVDDHFAVDGGNELVYVGDLDGTRVYRARFESGFVRYRWHDAGAAGYWTAEYPDGRVGYFGADAGGTTLANARVANADGDTFRYGLVALVDPSGRRIVRTYTKQDGWPLVDEIQYAFGGEATPRFSVRMGYEARTDVISDATPGYEIRLARRLATVQVLSDASVIRRYELAYESDADSGGMTRLATVAEYGRDGGKHPIEHRFTYSRTLGGACAVGCDQPFMVDMGTLSGGVDIRTGLAQLIDINGDSLPDVLVSTENGVHTFHIAELSTEGRPTFEGTAHASARTTGGSSFVPSHPGVQLLDVNGDGFTDIVDQVNGTALCNDGSGDWATGACVQDPSSLPPLPDDPSDAASEADPLGMRFFDYDNDKKIDLLRTPDAGTAFVSRNTGDGYASVTVDAVGAAFDAENLQLEDLNGDGLQDPVMLVAGASSSTLQYKLNLGFGRWSPSWTTVSLSDLSPSEVDGAALQDLDGDGLSDIVVVSATTVSYWRNENAGRFAARVDIGSGDVDGSIPERTSDETVLFADMNGNGTDDVVWISGSGHVRFLELYPVRPNLLSRIDNGIGFVRVLEYGTSAAQRARDAGTADAWENPLPQSMNVVTASDTWVTLTGGEDGAGVHERHELAYHDGFYDGVEKSFRGFEEVDRRLVTDVDDGQDPSLEVLQYDVGRTDPYHHGLLVRTATFGGPDADVPLREATSEYGDCPVAGVEGADPPVRYVCELAKGTLYQEGAAEAEWQQTRIERTFDGYGNVLVERELGVVATGSPDAPAACAACPTLPSGVHSGPCGATCLGDERITTTTYVTPGEDTGGAWLLRLPVRVEVSGSDGGPASETVTYYDGPSFIGLDAGKATKGLVSRVTARISEAETVDQSRTAYGAMGNVIATLDPNASPADPTTHYREYAYDSRGLRVTRVTVHAGDYELVQDLTYESSFLRVSESTAYRVVVDGADKTPRNASSYTYDEFDRPSAVIRPGDTREAPTMTYAFELADPVSRIVAKARRAPGGPMDLESVTCVDGRGRTVQARHRIADGSWRVDGFRELNAVGEPVRVFLPFGASSGACDTAPPEDVLYRSFRRDAVGRVIEETTPDASLFGSDSVSRTSYGPLSVRDADNLDSDSTSPFANTPVVKRFDGLERLIAIERALTAGGAPDVFRIGWDELGNLARVEDPAGNVREQEFDLNGRVVRTVDANAGQTTYIYDAAGNEVSRTDARGLVTKTEYDALNRRVTRYDAADAEATAETTVYDLDEGCSDCRNGAGRVVAVSYPLPGGAAGSDAIGYDPRGNRVILRRTLDGHAFDTTWTFDGDDEVATTTYPDGQTVAFTRDGISRPTAVDGVLSAIAYTPEGRVASVAHENGVTESYSYDALVRLSSGAVTGPSGDLLDWSLTHDRVGNIVAITDGVTAAGHPSHAARYTYDAYYRLTEAVLDPDGANETLTYAYDALDNVRSRTSSRGAGSPRHAGDFTYGGGGAGPNFATKVGGVAYGSDAAGFVTSRGDVQLVWDHRGRLAEVAAPGRALSEIGYGAENERVLKTADGGVTYYAAPGFAVRDGISSVYVEVDGRKVARLRSDALASALLPDGDADGHIDIADAWLGRAANGETPMRLLRSAARRLLLAAQGAETHLHEDLRGSIVAATDADGALVGARDFYPFGAERAATGWIDPVGFTGKELDTSAGLLHFRERYLDIASGRWTAVDPYFAVMDAERVVKLGQAMAGYAYVANNPVVSVDPTGEILFTLFIKPIRRKVLPYRDRKATAPRNPEKAAARQVKQDRLDTVKGQLAQTRAALERMPDPASASNPTARQQLKDARKTFEGQERALAREEYKLEGSLNSRDSSANAAFLLPDVLLVTTIIGGTGAVLFEAFKAPAGDGDDADDAEDETPGGGATTLFGRGN